MSAAELPDDIAITTLATLLDLTPRRCRQLVESGIAVPAARGRVRLPETIRALLADARENREAGALTDARAQLVRAKARAAEIELAKREGELIYLTDHDGIVDFIVGRFVTALSALPARIGGKDAFLRRRIEVECDRIRSEIAVAADRAADECRQQMEAQGDE